jgi:uncharacterized protein YdbL (DUF1318 family)
MNLKSTLLVAIIALLLTPFVAMAQDSSKEELQKRFKERYPKIAELKKDGVVGETSNGYLDFVDKKDPKAADLVDQENADRKELYALIAKEKGVKPEVVATQNAKRNFERAKPGEFLKEDGKWHKKT